MSTDMEDVLNLVREERGRQQVRYGSNDDLHDGTGPTATWCAVLDAGSVPANQVEKALRFDYEVHEDEHGKPTWMHLVREEVAEAFQEDDPVLLADELVQVAALCVSWVETLRTRHREWGVYVNGSIVTDPDWRCPADVMRSTHGFDLVGPVTVVHRELGSVDWVTLDGRVQP